MAASRGGSHAPTSVITPAPPSERVWQSTHNALPWPADRVGFLNDVYFCAGGILRLLRHDADLACGLDFDRPRIRQMPRKVRLSAAAIDQLPYLLTLTTIK